jgi:hypothetical protein
MAARQREDDIDAVPLQHLDREPAAVRLHEPLRGRRGDRREESSDRLDPGLGILELR